MISKHKLSLFLFIVLLKVKLLKPQIHLVLLILTTFPLDIIDSIVFCLWIATFNYILVNVRQAMSSIYITNYIVYVLRKNK